MEKLIIELDDNQKNTFKAAVKWFRTTQKKVISDFIDEYNKRFKTRQPEDKK